MKRFRNRLLITLAVLGPGLITAFADNDAGGVATYSVAAAKFGYSIFTTLIPITIILAITQEIGARIAIVTGKGLGALIREQFGIKTSLLVFSLLFLVNFGVILQDITGLKSALPLFQLDYRIFLPLLIFLLLLFLIKASYKKIEKFFFFLIVFYLAYFFSAILAKPDWGLAMKSLILPQKPVNFDYFYTAVAVLGTTVTAWGQFFVNSYIIDKKIPLNRLKYEQAEVLISSVMTNAFSLFMMIAVAATIYKFGIPISGAADASLAIKPFAGELAGMLFGLGLLIAGLLGSAIVPLSTAYVFSEMFGYEGSLDVTFTKSRLFYSFLLLQILLGTFVAFFPQISLFRITLYVDFFNGLMLPVIFYFLYKVANDEHLMGKYKNTRFQNVLLVSAAVVISIAALIGGVGKLLAI